MNDRTKSSISFDISFTEPQAHYVDIQVTLVGFPGEHLDLKMPTWTPGSYLIREFSRNVEQFYVQDSGKNTIPHQKTAKNTWRIFHQGQDIIVHYSVYGFESSVRTNFIDDTHAFLSPAATFMYIDGHLDHPATVTVHLPAEWSTVSTGLEKSPLADTYIAPHFDLLYDSPLEIGNQDTWMFEAAGVWHEYAMVGGGNYNKERLTEDVTKIIEEETKLWGSNPNDRYVFITHHYQNGGGGLEHLNSTVLGASRNGYTTPLSYQNYLGLVAHEYFHLWLVKRLRPLELGPFDYEKENYTSLLWIMEGFTAYYDNLIVRRCAFINENDYLLRLAIDFNTVYNRPGYQVQSAGLSSFDAWIKQYRPDENSTNSSISYYNKGAMLACALDLKILAETDGTYRLDHVLQAAYQYFHISLNRGFGEDEFKTLAEEVTGVELSEIFNAVYSTKELEYNRYFNAVGYELVDLNEGRNTPSLGIKTVANDTRIYIKGVDRNSSAWHAGLSVNDEIIAIDGIRMDPAGKELENALQTLAFGESLEIMVSRDAVIRTIQTTVGYSEKKDLVIRQDPNATDRQRQLGNIWLSLT